MKYDVDDIVLYRSRIGIVVEVNPAASGAPVRVHFNGINAIHDFTYSHSLLNFVRVYPQDLTKLNKILVKILFF